MKVKIEKEFSDIDTCMKFVNDVVVWLKAQNELYKYHITVEEGRGLV